MRDHIAGTIIALFTSPDRAIGITGDLAEEMGQRGSIRYWVEIIRVACALWRSATMQAPGKVCLLALLGSAVFAAPALAGLASINLFPTAMDATLRWVTFALFCWGGALWTGASLVALAPRHGMMACLALAVAGQVFAIGFGQSVTLSACALVAAVLLALGGIFARERRRMATTPASEVAQ